jgi:hypothetical protein
MSWFRYKKGEEEDFRYPYVKRYISNFIPFDDLELGSWLFCDLEGININQYYDGTVGQEGYNIESDNNSYIVVYENVGESNSENTENFIVVKSLIYDGKLFFQTADEHLANSIIPSRYAVYYKTPNLKINVNDPLIDFSEINLYNYRVNPLENKTYSFSFVNSALNWEKGSTDQPYAKVYGKFSGPNLRIYGKKSTKGGKFNIKFTILSEITGLEEEIDLDWQSIDTYSSVEEENVILFEKENFSLKDYSFEIETALNSNIKSAGREVKINYYEFTYNQFLKLEKEYINPEIHAYSQLKGNI